MNIIKLIIEKGVDLEYGLYGACKSGHMNIINLMIEKGASDWNWGLSNACQGSDIDIVKFLIEKGATECWNCHKSIEEHLKK